MSLRRFFQRSRADAELVREIELHLAEEIDENLARGMSPGEARRRAYLTAVREMCTELAENACVIEARVCQIADQLACLIARSPSR